MALQKVNRNLLNTGVSDSSDATAITIDSSENVGIGVTSSYPLTVQSGTAGGNHAIALRNNSTNNLARLGFLQQDSATAAYTSIDGDGRTSGYLRFNTNDTERMRINSSGVISHSAVAGSSAVICRTTAPTGSQGLNISAGVITSLPTTTPTFADNSSSGATIYLSGNAADQYGGSINLIAYGSGSDGNLITFSNRSGSTTTAERMRIDSSGKVGIGTTSPSSILHITSTTANTNGMVRLQNNMDNNYETLRIESLGDYDAHIGFFADGSSNYYWGMGVDYSDSGKFKIANDNLLATNTRLTLTTAGQIQSKSLGVSTPTFSFDNDTDTGMTRPTADTLQFVCGGTVKNRISSDGLLFNSDTAAANALDDYEEGGWTPTLTGNSAATYSVRNGRYTKVGNLVRARCAIKLSAWTSNGTEVEVTGLPYATVASGYDHDWGAVHMSSKPTDHVVVCGVINSKVFFRRQDISSADNGVVGGHVDADTGIMFTVVYQTT